MFDTVLVANRGEIALRIVRTCRELGIRTVVVYAADDRDSAAVELADRAISIGPASGRSYLNIPAVIEAAQWSGADAVHPGYGFLSEVADFAEVCESHGLAFVGPSASVMRDLADKSSTKALMREVGVPMLPGSGDAVETADEAKRVADRVGYPVIIKASAGGGGRGMRVVRSAGDIERAYQETRSNAWAFFRDSRVYLERYVEAARHVEVQVLCDGRGNGVALGERDCSVQRRHQKLVEETPATCVDRATAARMGEVAVEAALAVGYVGAGTFEFVVDEDGDFHFIEINCRLQVEHPVTEMVTGVDLVREQLRVASGEPLSMRQSDVEFRGAAVECRVNAEDPERGFVPTPGTLREFRTPGGPFVRVDTHGYAGYRMPASYDSLLAKTIAWGPDRAAALDRLRCRLGEFRIEGPGVCTTIGFLRDVLADPVFRGGRHTTSLIQDMTTSEQTAAHS
ncbi:acetyl-CoA carboxylase biotin carboxylase subunit [Streptomonospora arabica]|uniref:biotin carboxylase n=1 Tax=Streptomonospora arabica TaxID=412417 RepID=A0ABV9SHJ3_9ACTN